MYISRTPLRVSFFSGGDMESFYKRETGFCLSATINRYIYVSLIPQHNKDGIRLMYDTTQDVDNLDELKNHLVREVLRYLIVEGQWGITISSMSDVKSS